MISMMASSVCKQSGEEMGGSVPLSRYLQAALVNTIVLA
jgi:hypothetical protein